MYRKGSLKKSLDCGIAICLVGFISAMAVAADYNAVNKNGVRIFSKVPRVGVHPRVLMSPEDLPAWRKEVIKTYRGKTFFAKRYQSNAIDKLVAIDSAIPEKDLIAAYSDIGPGGNHQLLFATLDVIYHQDAQRAKYVCKAIANFARVIHARSKYEPKWGKIKKSIGDIKGNDGIPTGLNELWLRGGSDFALAYDYLYNYMTPKQRDLCRSALSLAAKDLVVWGMNFPRGRGVSNWYGYHGEFGPMLLAIEGEKGFRADQWKSFQQMIRDWAEVHIYETGGSNEDGYTLNTSLREGQFTLLAMARRGENHFERENIRKYFEWVVLSLVPGEDTGETVGYSSNRVNPYESAPVLARWIMPGDKNVNYYLRSYKGADYTRQNRWQYAPMSTLFCMNWEDSEELPLDMGKLGLPITKVFDYQGLFITRSDWSDDAAYLNMLARHDAWYDRHENVDRGRFVFAALGRRWAVDNYWGIAMKSTDHSLVHIDGVAQAEAKVGRGKAPNANLIKHGDIGKAEDADSISYAVMDLKNAYDWLWSHSWDKPGEGWEPELRTFEELGWIWKRDGQPQKLHGCDNETVPMYNFLGCNIWRKANNPVEYCWRTGVMVRGENPYAIIVDDVKKDDKDRAYDWYMPIAADLEFIPLANGGAMLVEKDEEQTYDRPNVGSRRLLILPMGQGKADIKMEEYVSSVSRGKAGNPGKANKARRLVISRKGDQANFRVVLYPFRTTIAPAGKTANDDYKKNPLGAETPAMSPASKNGFFIKAGGRKDQWGIIAGADGRSRIKLQRGNKKLQVD